MRADPIAGAASKSFEVKRSVRFDLAIPLPDGAHFEVDDRAERWFVATHPKTSSTLLVRTWREDDIGGRTRCEARARSWRALPEREGTRLIEARRIAVPPEHDTVAEVRIRPRTKTNPTEGIVLAFGGWAKKCFAYVFTTQDGDDRIVAARLATIVDGSLARLREESHLVVPRVPVDTGQ